MPADIKHELIAHLATAQAIERQSLGLMRTAIECSGDEQIAAIYRAHREETEDHVRCLAERAAACGGAGSTAGGVDSRLAALEIRFASPASSATLAAAAYALENLEIAAYHLLLGIAERAGDHQTVALAGRILEQEEAAAEVVASTFDRALEVSMGERPRSPVSHFGAGDAR